MVMELIRAARR